MIKISNCVTTIIPVEMVEKAKDLEINISRVAREALAKKIAEVEAERKVQP